MCLEFCLPLIDRMVGGVAVPFPSVALELVFEPFIPGLVHAVWLRTVIKGTDICLQIAKNMFPGWPLVPQTFREVGTTYAQTREFRISTKRKQNGQRNCSNSSPSGFLGRGGMRILSLQVSEKAKDETVPLSDCTSKACVDSGGMKWVASVLGANRLSVRAVDTDSDGCSDVSGGPTLGFCMTGRPPGGCSCSVAPENCFD